MTKHVHGSFEASPDAPGRARLLASDALGRWALADDDTRDRVVLLISELVTNAIRYCRRRVEVHVHLEGSTLRVDVVDDSPLQPEDLAADVLDEQGRGLQIVGALSARWGTEPDGDGKRVWFEVDIDESHRQEEPRRAP